MRAWLLSRLGTQQSWPKAHGWHASRCCHGWSPLVLPHVSGIQPTFPARRSGSPYCGPGSSSPSQQVAHRPSSLTSQLTCLPPSGPALGDLWPRPFVFQAPEQSAGCACQQKLCQPQAACSSPPPGYSVGPVFTSERAVARVVQEAHRCEAGWSSDLTGSPVVPGGKERRLGTGWPRSHSQIAESQGLGDTLAPVPSPHFTASQGLSLLPPSLWASIAGE